MDAAIELWRERRYDDITLQEIADRAAVSLSTVMRRFGSKEGVVDAILASDRLGTWGRRRRIATGDIGAAGRELVGDFELNGDGVIRNLALEQQLPAIRHAVETGRKLHREWVVQVFADTLARRKGRDYTCRLAQFVAATDVYTWKLFRRDHDLSKEETAHAMRDLLERLVKEQ